MGKMPFIEKKVISILLLDCPFLILITVETVPVVIFLSHQFSLVFILFTGENGQYSSFISNF
jgi:hypothetical protein